MIQAAGLLGDYYAMSKTMWSPDQDVIVQDVIVPQHVVHNFKYKDFRMHMCAFMYTNADTMHMMFSM